jgi:hypothetical protein
MDNKLEYDAAEEQVETCRQLYNLVKSKTDDFNWCGVTYINMMTRFHKLEKELKIEGNFSRNLKDFNTFFKIFIIEVAKILLNTATGGQMENFTQALFYFR